MSILVVSASMRDGSQSLKVASYLEQRLKAQAQDTVIMDLYKEKLPLYDPDQEVTAAKELLEKISKADGYVFVSPEWNGMMSHGLANLLQYVGNSDMMAHKPVMLVGVSAGRGGNYPVAQMRLMGYKNTHFVISPESLVVGGVKDMFNDQNIDESTNDYDLKRRAEYALKVLAEYSNALKAIRQGSVVDMSLFPNGV